MDVKVGWGNFHKNQNQETEAHPSHKGKFTIEQTIPAGSTLWFACWPKTGSDGSKFHSAVLSKSDGAQRSAPPKKTARDDMNDEIPF